MTDMDDQFEFPERVTDLQAVPPCWRDLYNASNDGFDLHPDAVRQMRELEAEYAQKLKAVQAEQDAKLAASERQTEALRKELHDRVSNRAIADALYSRGVKPGLLKAAVASFRAQYQLEIEKRADGGFDTLIADSYGRVPVADAVDVWLSDEEAKPFLPPPKATEGALTLALRRLRANVH
ncbi:hypothetical protein FJ938_13170 [Mesorhizobium sp. B2-4-14]|uniref:hypothetical protein n=1 Tax=Mesorhizobium sp. B2-4-14 TaxID=2589935 RepID=UPI001126B0F3|nr:hypothetical protein [Mesorhizobium sp. B2-4-14]TPL06424.1 hypothetical protein FJ938_13170 [Mesorhizobium sp. B2-4-14]